MGQTWSKLMFHCKNLGGIFNLVQKVYAIGSPIVSRVGSWHEVQVTNSQYQDIGSAKLR
jgi:hypothetical protein